MIHGTPGGYDQGLVIAEMLGATQFQFIAVSRPGYLRTPLAVGKAPEEQADAFVALLDVLNVEKAAAVGLSGGGPSTLQFALRHPDRCWGVVLISAITRPRPASQRSLGYKILHSVIFSSDVNGWLCTRLVKNMPAWMIRKPSQRGRLASLQKFVETVVPYSLRGAGHANDSTQFGLLPVYPLKGVQSPTLVLHGTADGPVPFAHAEFAASTIPKAELITVAHGGHGVLFTHSEEIIPKIVRFLEVHVPAV
jgi:pimeloyl-ACP methyl ester carboxylesterase